MLNTSMSQHLGLEISLSADHSPPEDTPPATRWQRVCIVLSLVYVNFWVTASMSIQAPFFPQEAELKGATPSQFGLVFGVFELVIIIVSPICAVLIPRISPKAIIITGALTGGTACCVFGSLDYVPAGQLFLALAFITRMFEGVGTAAVVTGSFPAIAAAFPESVATSFSILETAHGLGLIVGPTIGGVLFQSGGFILPFEVNGVCLYVGSIVLFFLLPSVGVSGRRSSNENIRKFLLDGGIISYTLAIVTALLTMGFNSATLEPHVRMFHLEPVYLGLLFIISGGMYAITSPVLGRLIDEGANPLYVCIFGYIMTCAGILFLGPVSFIEFNPSLGTVIMSLLLIGAGTSAKIVSASGGMLQNTIKRGFPNDLGTYSMISALFSMSCSTGAFIGPSLGGFLLDTTGYRVGTVVIFALDVSFLVLLVSYVLHASHRRTHVAEDSCCEQEPLLTNSLEKMQNNCHSM